MGHSNSKLEAQRLLELKQDRSWAEFNDKFPLGQQPVLPTPPLSPKPSQLPPSYEYHNNPQAYQILAERGRFSQARRGAVSFPITAVVAPCQDTLSIHGISNLSPYGQSFDSDEDVEMIRYVSLMSLEDSLTEPQQPRPRGIKPTLSAPRQPRHQISQPNFSRPIPPISPSAHPRYRASHSDLNTPRQPRQRTSQPDLLTTPPHKRITRAVSGTAAYENLVDLRGGRKKRHHNRIDEEAPIPTLQTPATRECAICIEKKPVKEFPAMTGNCKHKSTTCLICVQAWIKGELNALSWDKLKCVGAGCKAILKHEDVRRLASPDIFEKYDHFATLCVISKMPSFRWCLSPRCKSGQLHTTGTDGPIFRCIACGSKACVVHNVKWHEGITCREYDYAKNPKLKKLEEEASEKLVKELSRRCPGKGCGAPIERNGGCDHMTCTKCKHEFCWLCFADYGSIRKKGNTAHRSTCRLHTKNLT